MSTFGLRGGTLPTDRPIERIFFDRIEYDLGPYSYGSSPPCTPLRQGLPMPLIPSMIPKHSLDMDFLRPILLWLPSSKARRHPLRKGFIWALLRGALPSMVHRKPLGRAFQQALVLWLSRTLQDNPRQGHPEAPTSMASSMFVPSYCFSANFTKRPIFILWPHGLAPYGLGP